MILRKMKINGILILENIQKKKKFYISVRQYSTKQNKMQKEETKKIIEYNLLQVPGQILIIAFLNKFLKTLY